MVTGKEKCVLLYHIATTDHMCIQVAALGNLDLSLIYITSNTING